MSIVTCRQQHNFELICLENGTFNLYTLIMFKVVNGGLSEGSAGSRKKFISSYITNTRLMGVTGITVHWKLTDNETNTEFWQCFYLDAEEFGFDSYESVTGPDTEETERKAMALADRLMGGLGGIPVEITERETRGLIQDYILLNRKKGIPIPEDAEVDFIMRPEVILTLDERKQLMDKQCEEITGEYQLVNYFIMRCVGHDLEAARYLATDGVDLSAFRGRRPAALIRNACELAGGHDGLDLVAGVEVRRADSCVSEADAHQSGTVSLAGRRDFGRIKTDLLCKIVKREPLALVVAYLIVRAGGLHRISDLFGDLAVFGSHSVPSFGMQVPCLCAYFPAGLVSCSAAGCFAIFVTLR